MHKYCTSVFESDQDLVFRYIFNTYFIFQLQFTFNIVLYQFQMYRIVIQKSCTLQSGPPDVTSTHLALFIVIMILLTIFLIL